MTAGKNCERKETVKFMFSHMMMMLIQNRTIPLRIVMRP